MLEFEFVESVQDSCLAGRNGDTEIPLHSVFTQLVFRTYHLEGGHVLSTTERSEAVLLELVEIQWYGRSIDVLPAGHTGGLRLNGDGFDLVEAAIAALPRSPDVNLFSPQELEAYRASKREIQLLFLRVL